MKIKSYKDLKVWLKGIEIVDQIYDATDSFPDREQYGLVSQMRRAAVSIPSNVAEGFARQNPKEFRRFCFISLGSCEELETQMIIAHRRQYIPLDLFKNIEDVLNHESRMLMSLAKRLAP